MDLRCPLVGPSHGRNNYLEVSAGDLTGRLCPFPTDADHWPFERPHPFRDPRFAYAPPAGAAPFAEPTDPVWSTLDQREKARLLALGLLAHLACGVGGE